MYAAYIFLIQRVLLPVYIVSYITTSLELTSILLNNSYKRIDKKLALQKAARPPDNNQI